MQTESVGIHVTVKCLTCSTSCCFDYPGSVRWQHLLGPLTDNTYQPAKCPDCLLGEVTQPSDRRFNETSFYVVASPSFSRYSHSSGEIEDYSEEDYRQGRHQHVYVYYKSLYKRAEPQLEVAEVT